MPNHREHSAVLQPVYQWFLAAYDRADFVTAQKAKVFVGLYLTSMVAGIAYMAIDAPDNPVTILVVAPSLALSALGLSALRRGHFSVASNGLLVGWLTITFVEMFLDMGPKVERLDTIITVAGILAVAPLTVRKRTSAVVAYFALALVVFAVFVFVESRKQDLSDVSLLEYGLDSTVGILICGVACYYLFAINKRALDQAAQSIALAETEAENNRELNRTLESKVEERTRDLNQANQTLAGTNLELTRARDALWGEMELAKKIQTVLLPRHPTIDGYEIAAWMAPADEVGGDYYDVINCHGTDWIVIGDVSGHGVESGLVMMMVQMAIHVTLDHHPNLAPSEVLTFINKALIRNLRLLGESKYVTITVLAVHKDGWLSFSGLHQDILVHRGASHEIETLPTNGIWLGVVDDIRGMVPEDEFHLNPDDTLLLYTDGITEAWRKGIARQDRKAARDTFGLGRLRRAFGALADRSPEQIRRGILKALEDYDCSDDVTLVAVKRVA